MATFDVEHPLLGTTNEHPKSVNSGKITSALHVFYLNLNLLAQNSANCSDTGECTPCSDAISGPKNRVFDIKSGHDFCRYRNSIQVIYFQISGLTASFKILKRNEVMWILIDLVFP